MPADGDTKDVNPDAPVPPLLIERLRRLGDALGEDLVAGLGQRPSPTGRVLAPSCAVPGVLDGLRERGLDVRPLRGLDAGFSVPIEQRGALLADPAVEAGSVYVQGASSQRAADLLGASPGEWILDLAAAPGGKTMVLAQAMEGEGRLVAVEPIRDRYYRLLANLERSGFDWVETVRSDGRKLPSSFRAAFDRVLLDAPCSADVRIDLGDPETYGRWGLAKVRDLARKQWGLLGAALWAVKPGGVVVYSTCTFAPEEDEAIVAAHLADPECPAESGKPRAEVVGFELDPSVRAAPGVTAFGKKRWPDAVRGTRRILPDAQHEGFFVAKLRRVDEPDAARGRSIHAGRGRRRRRR